MRASSAKPRTGALQQTVEPSPATPAATFATVLDIMFLSQTGAAGLDIRQLRSICKETRSVVDYYVKTFNIDDEWRSKPTRLPPDYLRSISPWPWPYITQLSLGDNYGGDQDSLQKEVEHMVTLKLPQLQFLRLKCGNVLPLLESRWPNLTGLDLEVAGGAIEYPEEMKFPIKSLKKLTLCFVGSIDPEKGRNDTFLAAFLRSCPALTKLKIYDSYFCDEELATTIISAPLRQLHSLKIESPVYEGFVPKILEGNWPNLKYLKIKYTEDKTTLIPQISSQVWVTTLEELYLGNNYAPDYATSSELHTFLRALEKGAIQRLTIVELTLSSLLDGFQGICLNHLKALNLERLYLEHIGGLPNTSQFINTFFDNRSLPVLEQLTFHIDDDYSPDEMYNWDLPPRTTDPRQPLKTLSFRGLNMSREVASYLGNLIKHAGCAIDVEECFAPEVELSPERLELLNKLGLTTEDWSNFCISRESSFVPTYLYEQCMYWGSMSDGQFKRIAYAALLQDATRIPELAKFIRLVKNEEEGSVIKDIYALEMLKTGLEGLWNAYKETGDDENRLPPWEIRDFIDFRK
jgi:hypothetical protein